jgi:hypothetical protein
MLAVSLVLGVLFVQLVAMEFCSEEGREEMMRCGEMNV